MVSLHGTDEEEFTHSSLMIPVGTYTEEIAVVEGRWRIVETELWDQEALNLVAPAHITFGRNGLGEMELIAIGASIDYRVTERGGAPIVEFSWSGFDEMDPTTGRAWATIEGDTLRGKLFIHQGDESGFIAKRERADRDVSGSNRPLQPPAAARARRGRTRKRVRRGRG
ncbi:MAG: hypothetical protein HY652_07915 [Acidobacteria bacterium]|nr:hypothetical protein [Acidobacteriota bacterium]